MEGIEKITAKIAQDAQAEINKLAAETDEKVLLHELLHLKYHDAAWGLVICLFRCLHWCNPLLWYCADRAGNDLESLCDQRVLERLEGGGPAGLRPHPPGDGRREIRSGPRHLLHGQRREEHPPAD